MAAKALFEVDGSGNKWYGTFVLSNFRREDGGPLVVQKFLGLKFKHPPLDHLHPDITISSTLFPWQALSLEVISTETIDYKTVATSAKLLFNPSYGFHPGNTITFGLNADMSGDLTPYLESFEGFVDFLPGGTVTVTCKPAPDPALEGLQQTVNLIGTGTSLPLKGWPGKQTPNPGVPAATYQVVAMELATSDLTVAVPATAKPVKLPVKVNETTDVQVTYGEVTKTCALDIVIGEVPPAFGNETFEVRVTGPHRTYEDYYSLGNSTHSLRRLDVAGTCSIYGNFVINNLEYWLLELSELANKLVTVNITEKNWHSHPINSGGFFKVPITLKDTEKAIRDKNSNISVRLRSMNGPWVYTQNVDPSKPLSYFDVRIAPGEYSVVAEGFIDQEGTVYRVEAPATLRVKQDAGLELKIRRGANLHVKGFPSKLTFGGLTDHVDLTGADFAEARASSAFKYAGKDGAGDGGLYLDEDPGTENTIKLANSVQAVLNSKPPFLPMMISYTCDLSGGNMANLQNRERLAHSFGNLMFSLTKARSMMVKGRELCGVWVVNPDFLGMCQQKGLSPEYEMPVRGPLEDAIKYRQLHLSVPDDIGDNLKGYVQAVNWIFRAVVENATFSWQVNLWGGGSSLWVYKDESWAKSEAKSTVDYIKSLGVYEGKNRPDFLAIDRYEADDFTTRAMDNGYCYGPNEWKVFFAFCGYVSLGLQTPVAPWQIPASRIPNRDEQVRDLNAEKWGTGGTYTFGDARIGGDIENINSKILDIKLNTQLIPHPTVRDLFESAKPFNLALPACKDFLKYGVFTVLLGGGTTTGIVRSIGTTSEWTRTKIREYMKNPIPFNDHSQTLRS